MTIVVRKSENIISVDRTGPDGAVALAAANRAELAEVNAESAAAQAVAAAIAIGPIIGDVLVAATDDITLSGEQTISGQTTNASRVLLTAQSDASKNGVWTTAAGAWARHDVPGHSAGLLVTVNGGDLVAQWKLTTTGPITVDTTDLAFVKISESRPAVFINKSAMAQSAISQDLAIFDGEIWQKKTAADYTDDVTNDPAENNNVPSTFDVAKIWIRKNFHARDYVKIDDFSDSSETHDGPALVRALADRREVIVPQIYTVKQKIIIPAYGLKMRGEGPDVSGFQLEVDSNIGGAHILFHLLDMDGQVLIEDLAIDGKNGGQLDAGLIQVSGSADRFAIFRRVMMRNGGVIQDAPPQGVNAIAVAGSTYPGGSKARVLIEACDFDHFTKAAVNLTTLCEEAYVDKSTVRNAIGNNFSVGFQSNGARKAHFTSCRTFGTEGAAITVATVGTTPPYESQDILIDGCEFNDAGQLGTSHLEGHGILISDASNSGSSANFTVRLGTNVVKNPYSQGLYAATFGGRIVGDQLIVEDATIGALFQNISGVRFNSMDFTNVNSRAISGSGIACIWANNASDIEINRVKYRNVSDSTPPEHIVYGTTAASDRVKVKNIELQGTISSTIIGQSDAGMLRQGKYSWERIYTANNGQTLYDTFLALADGEVAKIKTEVTGICDSDVSDQILLGTARAASGAATLRTPTAIVDERPGEFASKGAEITVAGNVLEGKLNAPTNEGATFIVKTELTTQ